MNKNTCNPLADHVGILPPALEHQDHGEGLGGEVQDGPDQEIEKEPPGEVLPGQRQTVHDEGRREPVEVHDQRLQPATRKRKC